MENFQREKNQFNMRLHHLRAKLQGIDTEPQTHPLHSGSFSPGT